MTSRQIRIDDPEDPRLGVYLGLRDHQARQRRERPGGDMATTFMAEGGMVIARGIDAGHRLLSVLVDPQRVGSVAAIASEDVPIYVAGPEVLRRIAGRATLRDAIGCFRRPPPPDLADLLARSRTLAVLEGVVNPTNMGVIVRCAAGLGSDALLVDPTSVDPLYRRSVRVSMGEVFAIAHARLPAFPEGLGVLARAGFQIVALTPDPPAIDIRRHRRKPGDKVAVLLGTEGPGLTDAALAAAHTRVRIPMAAGVDSINVGAAAAIALHALSDDTPRSRDAHRE